MRRAPLRIALSLVAVVAIVAIRYARNDAPPNVPAGTPPHASDSPDARSTTTGGALPGPAGQSAPRSRGDGNDAIAAAYRERRSDVWVEGHGTVEATLPDDREGSRHQKFVVRVDRDLTLLVSHNIDLAPRVPLDKGDRVAFRGEYVWNAKGGLVHWTHHDPRGGRGGWIRVGDRVYE